MKKKVLIFDDDIDLLEMCAIILENHAYEVFTRTNCENIGDILTRTDPDLIVMDNKIPPVGGIDASLEIKKSNDFKDTPIIFFSAHQNVETLAQKAKAEFFLEKPFDLNAFVNLVQIAIG